MGRVDGKVAVISGGARGMGASHARALVAEGAKVVAGDILDEEGAALASRSSAPQRASFHLDVTAPELWKTAVATAVDEFGRLDILVNNAGISNGNLLEHFELAEWQKILDINLTGTFLGMQAAVRAMKDTGGGSIINMSSVEGLRGSPGMHGYVASKWAIRGITKSAALELAPSGIRVNSIHPGFDPHADDRADSRELPADPARPRRRPGGGVQPGLVSGVGRVGLQHRLGIHHRRRPDPACPVQRRLTADRSLRWGA